MDRPNLIPITKWLPNYNKTLLRPDTVAGLTVWALLVPEAMAYAELAGMPPETGLYAALGAITGYAIFGTSKQLFVGPSSTVAILSLSTVAAVATNDNVIQLSVALALLVGVMYIFFGLLKLGFISVFMSKSVLTGFTFGLGLTIAIGQMDKLLGVEGGSGNFVEKLKALIEALPDVHGLSATIGLVALVILLLSRKFFGHSVPMALIVVFGSIALSVWLGWESKGVHVVGEIPAKIPGIAVPDVHLSDIIGLVPGALGIVIVGYAESFGAAEIYARKHDYEIDPDQELIALGAANVGAGVLGGFTVDGSLSRSAAGDEAGGRTQMAMLICGAITLVTILALTPLFAELPETILAAIVISAVWGTFNVAEMRRIWHSNKLDFAAALTALIGVCVVDLLPGLMIAVLLSFILMIYKAAKPEMPKLGKLPAGPYVDEKRWHTEPTPGLLIVRLDGPLFFANSHGFEERVDELLREEDEPPGAVILNLETTNYVDTDGTDTLRSIKEMLQDRGIRLLIARLNQEGREAIMNSGKEGDFAPEDFFPSVRLAVKATTGAAEDEIDFLVKRAQKDY